jgi:CO/xanthine dehydrogenase FAD-binding subunit
VIEVDDGAITGARVVAGSVGQRPQRLPETEANLRGQPAAASTAMIAADVIRDEVETSGDVFESEAYTRQLARTVGRRAMAVAIQRATGEEGGRRAA